MITAWPCLTAEGGLAEEYAVTFDTGRGARLLIVPALFDEANRMRRLSLDVMRRLDRAGIDCFLPDLPGCNESLQPLEAQTPSSWRAAMAAAAAHFRASHLLSIRGGALVAPDLPGWRYAPVTGASLLRQMLRTRIVASREAGRDETQEALWAEGLVGGIDLSGHRLGAEFLRQFQPLVAEDSPQMSEIGQDMVGGGGLWLRAEPDEDRAQADALAAIVAIGIRAGATA